MTDVRNYNPKTLAFMGDAVYEALVREKIILDSERPIGELNKLKTKIVCAEAQSEVYGFLENLLSEEENAVMKRGRNISAVNGPKSANIGDYRRATGIEALFGYLYLSKKNERIRELFEIIWDREQKLILNGYLA